ncbi:WecB/TagA/CpsF family glycosyltransferase [Candidatus Uhrbacteria bacterium]|nr:WecB/TagA/CpsF family glycosyltransferase [Candidatus Uhrbacteria bacterium]
MQTSVDNIERKNVLGVAVQTYTQAQIISAIIQEVGKHQKKVLSTINPEFVIAANRNQWFRNALNASDWSVIDGVGIHWALLFDRRSAGQGVVGRSIVWAWTVLEFAIRSIVSPHSMGARVTGSDLLPALFAALPPQTRIFVMGGKSEAIGDLTTVLQKRFPTLSWCGVEHGPRNIRIISSGIACDNTEDAAVCKRIAQSGAEIIVVGFGQIKQELWIQEHRERFPDASVFIGVGGALDFLSRASQRSPKVIAGRGLEWFWRLFVEPFRLKRIVNATIVFPWLVLCDALRRAKMATVVGSTGGS